jgi:hypothetical protein
VSLRAWALRVAAVLAVPLAALLSALAVDVLRVPGELESGDIRFDAAPRRQSAPWAGLDFLRGWPAARALDVGDDIAYRRLLARFLRVEPGRVEVYGPRLENLKGRVQLELTQLSAADANPHRRAQLLNLLAAMSLERYSSDAAESESILRRAVHMFRSAVETDPGNADAKLNLELALRNAKATNLPGTDPDAGAATGTISGTGRAGSGY